jgi:anti-sigma B factor antagonist
MHAFGFGGTVEATPDVATLTLDGEADLAVRADFQALVDQLLATSSPSLVVDLAALRYLESACLRVLLHAHSAAERDGRTLTVRGAAGIVRRVLEVSGVAEILTGGASGPDDDLGDGADYGGAR